MKKLLTLALLLTIGAVQAQRSDTETFSVTMTAGTSMGAELEYKGAIAYIRPSLQFAKLSTDIYSGIGINFNEDADNLLRYYVGGRLGVTIRENTNAMSGYESGIDIRIAKGLILGIRVSNDYKSDYTFYPDGKKWNQEFVLKFGAEW